MGRATKKNPLLASAIGAALTVFAGLLLLGPLGGAWTNASYDYLFRFGSRAATNRVALVLMDNSAIDHFGQTRGQPWDRALHAQLLNRLADDGCAMVVFDSFFRELHDPVKDGALAAAMRREKHVVLMAEQAEMTGPQVIGAEPILPAKEFLDAAKTNWGVACLDADSHLAVRQQWPFPSPGPYPSLPWTAARVAGKNLSVEPEERWVRYYGEHGSWTTMSYQFALTQPPNYFRNQIVFIGNWPATSARDGETDKFSTPYTRWTDEMSGGVEILLTSFLNLLNDDSLFRPPGWIELCLFIVTGILLGGGLCRLRAPVAAVVAVGLALIVSLSAISLSYFTNYWFPWLVVVGGQVPCALAWTFALRIRDGLRPAVIAPTEPLPATPGYELVYPIGEGSYGKVWLTQTKAKQWRALKVVNLAKFGEEPGPYEREYNGVKRYQPISDQHPGLLRVDFVSEKQRDYFYYVMELGDSLQPGWENNPSAYKPRDMVTERANLPKRRLPLEECIRAGIVLCDALDFLHRQGLTHRDIKPQNIIYVNGLPKLADLGLITDIRLDETRTLVGTPGYMPPSPERPGTVAADIYALGMVLYVLSTGRPVVQYPAVATTLVSTGEPPEFLPLNEVILKACSPAPEDRYASAREMGLALEAVRTLREK